MHVCGFFCAFLCVLFLPNIWPAEKQRFAQKCAEKRKKTLLCNSPFCHTPFCLSPNRESQSTESHFTCFSPRYALQVVPSTFLLNFFWAFLAGLGRESTVLLQNPRVTSRKACLRHADSGMLDNATHTRPPPTLGKPKRLVSPIQEDCLGNHTERRTVIHKRRGATVTVLSLFS